MRRRLRAFCYKIGYRGSFLLFLSTLDIIYGAALLASRADFSHSPAHLFIFSLTTWALIWLVLGVFLLTGVLIRNDKFHYAAAATNKSLWALVWLRVWIDNDLRLAWLQAIFWIIFAAVTVLISFWPEPKKVMRNDEISSEP